MSPTGIERLTAAFERCRQAKKTALVAFITGGHTSPEVTPEALMGLQEGGADVIEVGVPFSDPTADGPVIQKASTLSLTFNTSITDCLNHVKNARKMGLTIPVVFMTYINPVIKMGFDNLCQSCVEAQIDGFILVDVPHEHMSTDWGDGHISKIADNYKLSIIPLVAPSSSEERIQAIVSSATSFIYLISLSGVTGARDFDSWKISVSPISNQAKIIKKYSSKPIALGFGISEPRHVSHVCELGCDAAVIGSVLVKLINEIKTPSKIREKVKDFCATMSSATFNKGLDAPQCAGISHSNSPSTILSKNAWFQGYFGGQFIPEPLMLAHKQLEKAFEEAMVDPSFLSELARYRRQYIHGPTPIHHAKRLSEVSQGAQIWLKREELAFTGSHKINNAIGQALLAKRLGKTEVIAETGAGQHGVATATACALLGLRCCVFMGANDVKRQQLNVFRMKMLGAEVKPVTSGSQTLKDAVNQALADWVEKAETTHYLIGSAIGPHPFPTIVKTFQSVIGKEARAQMLNEGEFEVGSLNGGCGPGRLPDVIIACVGGGSNAIGIFSAFEKDDKVELIGVEGGGEKGPEGLHSATLSAGAVGIFHGARSLLLQNGAGQIEDTHSVSAGLDYPGVGPEHSSLKSSGRATYTWATDSQALDSVELLSRTEGITPALEPAHAVAVALNKAKTMPKDSIILVNLCGRGDKDMYTLANHPRFHYN
eukprot:GHVN01076791.1.p1 GENE.GHVN01076791.1~~GHVN01076791.1.p1  ORF type:complete len:712 (+),score=146.91 GHVN01076791.1:48-2183(+)